MKDFRNKTVVITGAGAGMGRCYAEQFGKLGARLALNDFDAQGLAETARLLQQQGVPESNIYTEAFDVSNGEAMFRFADNVKQHLGAAQVVINNAGVSGKGKGFLQLTPEQFERTVQINFNGVLYGCRAFLPQLETHDEAVLVNVSSVFGLIGMAGNTDYCATKFAVRGLSEALMVEMHGTPVSVHLVHPGGIRTSIAKGTPDGDEFTARFLRTEPDDMVREVIRGIQKGKQRIVYGHNAFKSWLISWAMPLEWRTKAIYQDMKGMIERGRQAAREQQGR